MSGQVQIRVTRRFNTPAERVFDAWLDTTMIARFAFGSHLRDEEVVHLKNEPRVGGRFSYLVRRNGEEVDHVGEYREINRPRRLVFTWGIVQHGGDTSLVTIDITAIGHSCELMLTHDMDAVWAEYADRTKAGWTKMTDELEKALDD